MFNHLRLVFAAYDDTGKPEPRFTLNLLPSVPYAKTCPSRRSREGQPSAARLWIAQIDQNLVVDDVAFAFQPGKTLVWTRRAKLRIEGHPPRSAPLAPTVVMGLSGQERRIDIA